MIEVNKNPSRRQLLGFSAGVFPAFWGLVSLLVWLRGDRPRAAAAIAAVAALLSIVATLWPALSRWLYLGMTYAVYPIGWVVSHVLLLLLYYLVLTPIGIIVRLTGRDPMRRELDRDAPTYWIERTPQQDPERYFRQY